MALRHSSPPGKIKGSRMMPLFHRLRRSVALFICPEMGVEARLKAVRMASLDPHHAAFIVAGSVLTTEKASAFRSALDAAIFDQWSFRDLADTAAAVLGREPSAEGRTGVDQ